MAQLPQAIAGRMLLAIILAPFVMAIALLTSFNFSMLYHNRRRTSHSLREVVPSILGLALAMAVASGLYLMFIGVMK